MERRVKERLIGATILVVLVVLIVPEFLPGPHPAADRQDPETPGRLLRYRVDDVNIATQPPAAQGPAITVPVAEAQPGIASPASSPAPSAPPSEAAPATAGVTTVPPAAAPKPAPAPAAAQQPALIAPAATAGGWTVQLGSFASRANAETLQRQLKAEGFNVYLAPIGSGSATRYRVRLGPVADRSAAAAIMARLQAHQHAATLVPPAG